MGLLGTRAGRYRLLGLLASAVVLGLVLPGLASAQVFYPTDRYDCFITYADGGVHYVDSYQFETGQRYAVGYRKTSSTTGLGQQFGKGTYILSGKKIVSKRGYLTTLHEYLLIGTGHLDIYKNHGAWQGISCYDYKHTRPPSGGGTTFPTGTYTCYWTVAELGGTYLQQYTQITFNSDGSYSKLAAGFTSNGWKQQADTILFTAGPFWNTYAHDKGTWYPSGGKPLPNAQNSSTQGVVFPLVIKDTVAEDGNPPSQEFVTNDGRSASVPQSYWYCKK